MSSIARSIKEEKEVSEALDAAAKKYARLDDFWEAWKWRLARGPDKEAVMVPDTNPQVWIIKTDDYSHFKAPVAATMLYRFDDNEVHILAIKIE
jgi:hypothetical protein